MFTPFLVRCLLAVCDPQPPDQALVDCLACGRKRSGRRRRAVQERPI